MDWQRNVLIIAIVAVLGILFVRWNEFRAEQTAEARESASETVTVPEVPQSGVPQSAPEEEGEAAIPSAAEPESDAAKVAPSSDEGRLITVTTDTLRLVIDTYGGDIVRAELLEHRQSLKSNADPMVLLNRTGRELYIAQSGLIGPDGTDTSGSRPLFRADSTSYKLDAGSDQLQVNLRYEQGETVINKQFVLRRGDYLVDVRYRIENRSTEAWRGTLFGQIQRDDHMPPAGDGLGMQPYVGAAITTPENNYKKLDFDDLEESAFRTEKKGGWVAMLQHYFLSAWVPDQESDNEFTLRKLKNRDLYTFGFISPLRTVEPGQTGELSAGFYVGPKDQYRLKEISPYLDLTIDYGWLWWIAKPIFALMTFIHGLVGNWGWTIILLTVVIKAAFFKLSATSYRSMAKMRKLQPEMQRLKELYGDDRQKLSQEMMSFYKREKVNPLGGCLPILVQMPVFIALYWVLFESVELRHAPWILWINDLSVKDPFFVLPVLNGLCMYATTLLQPEPPDPMQAKVMKIMPVAFSFLFAFFPAGLVLYWTVNSLLSIAQQWYITRKVEAS